MVVPLPTELFTSVRVPVRPYPNRRNLGR
eukprot:SAG31_NODE_44072_length_264_cov_0.903030_1_plen_28_part_10